MKLAVFDIDGTLADTTKVDSECFARAVTEEFGIHENNIDWSTFDNHTDSGIAGALFKRTFGKLPTEGDLFRLKKRFIHYLENSFAIQPVAFRQIPGASSLLNHLTVHPEWSFSYATGSWFESAIFKLKSVRLQYDQIPLSSSDDAIDRVSIVKQSIERARQFNPGQRFKNIVLVGDRVWDAQTAHSLNLPFIGVGKRECFGDFSEIGIISDYLNLNRCFDLLESASVPQKSTSHAHFA